MTREEKMKIVINNYFKTECSVNTSIREAFEKGFRIGASKVQKKHGKRIERESGIEDKEEGFETVIVCSCCDFPATTFYSENCESRTQIRTRFCTNCGADMLEKLPSAQPERRKGRWINDVAYYDEEGCPCIVTRCDQCGEPGNGNYCSYCGANMMEEKHEAN